MGTSSLDIHDDVLNPVPARLGRVLVQAANNEPASGVAKWLLGDVIELLERSGFDPVREPAGDEIAEVAVGGNPPEVSLPRVYVDYDNWRVAVGRAPVKATESLERKPNSITSMAAAAAAVSEVYRLGPWTEAAAARSPGVVLSLLREDRGVPLEISTDPIRFPPSPITVFGCGSIAHAAGAMLARTPIQRGSVRLVDNSIVQPKNVRKYLGVGAGDLGLPKVETLARLLTKAGFATSTFQGTVNGLDDVSRNASQLVISATDTAISRRDIQAKLPGVVLDAWSGNDPLMLQAGVGWHGFGIGGSCLICEHFRDLDPRPDLEVEARKYGYTAAEFHEAIRENRQLPPRSGMPTPTTEVLRPYGGRCDEVPSIDGRRQYSVPFVSATAGALLALELTIAASPSLWPFRRPEPELRVGIHPGGYSLYPARSARRPTCLCSDELWVETYERKWPKLEYDGFLEAALPWGPRA